jgi:hypothetical protein
MPATSEYFLDKVAFIVQQEAFILLRAGYFCGPSDLRVTDVPVVHLSRRMKVWEWLSSTLLFSLTTTQLQQPQNVQKSRERQRASK